MDIVLAACLDSIIQGISPLIGPMYRLIQYEEPSLATCSRIPHRMVGVPGVDGEARFEQKLEGRRPNT